ncbi:MAG: hypothetical protein KDC66_12135 [Phaeodactylibacter sp.]|nr:hypothetical protein [Phaeodactylibacter sp.]
MHINAFGKAPERQGQGYQNEPKQNGELYIPGRLLFKSEILKEQGQLKEHQKAVQGIDPKREIFNECCRPVEIGKNNRHQGADENNLIQQVELKVVFLLIPGEQENTQQKEESTQHETVKRLIDKILNA